MITQNRIKTILTLAAVAMVALAATSAYADLVAYWPLSDGPVDTTVTGADDVIDAGLTFTDAVPKSNGDTWVFDAERNSIVLSTTEKNRLTGGTQGIDLADGFSWSLWVKASSSNITDTGADTIIGTRSGSPWHKIDVSAGTGNWTGISLPSTLADDTWHHIAYVGDMTDVSLYIDGNFAGKDTTPASTTFNGPLQFGGNDSWDEDITGLMSDIAIWDERLSEDRIEDLAAGGAVLGSVDAGADMITWSGQGVQLDPNFVDPYTPTSFSWTADPDTGVVFTPNDGGDGSTSSAEAPIVTITKDTDNPSPVKLTLAVTDGTDAYGSSMTIDVYDDACLAAKAVGPVAFDPTDIDENCITNFADFAVMAITWLDDYTLTEPVAK